MPTGPRLRFKGATYHAMSRGNRTDVFIDDRDRRRFLAIVQTALERYSALCYGYCLMGNHYHLVIRTPKANVSAVMQYINGCYAGYANRRHGWRGHLFERRFKSPVIGDDSYLRTALGYIAYNPVKAGMVTRARDWPWSHHRAVMNRCAPPSFLTVDWISTLFPAATLKASRQLYERHVVASANGALPDALLIGGTEALTRSVRSLIGATLFLAAVPRSTRGLARPPLFELFDGIRKRDRRRTILRAHVVHGYQLSEIARHLDLHPTTVSRIVNGTGTYQATIASE